MPKLDAGADGNEEHATHEALPRSFDTMPEVRVASEEDSAHTGPLAQGASLGRFTVLELLGSGRMGSVYAAWDPQLGRRVALKVLNTQQALMSERARMMREARALAQLAHANVVRVYELGEVDRCPFIAMELIEGATLRHVVQNRRLSTSKLLELFTSAALGLAAVHKLDIVHRDFKPANVFVGDDGRVCIGDFGLAMSKAEDTTPSDESPQDKAPRKESLASHPQPPRLGAVTMHGIVVGTPAFMAPEQLQDEPLDARCDQFAFCVSLWTALYGAAPFARHRALLQRLEAQRVPPARPNARSAVARALETPLRRGLSFDREQRFADMGALVAAIDEARRRPRRQRIAAALAVTAVVVVAGGAVFAQAARDPCGVRTRAASAFSSEQRDALSRSAPLSTSKAHLEAYLARWTATAETVCFSEDASMPHRAAVQACLARRVGDVSALAAVLTTRPDEAAAAEALPAVLALPTPAACLLESGAARAADAALEAQLAAARADWLAGRPGDARAAAQQIAQAAAAQHDTEMHAEASQIEGEAAADLGDLVGAETALRAAIAGAMSAKDLVLEASAWADLLNLLGDRARRFDEARLLVPFMRAAVDRVADDVDVLAKARVAEALLASGLGDVKNAEVLAREAIAAAERRVPHDPRFLSRSHNVLGTILSRLGRIKDSIAELQAARLALEGALPPGHASFAAVDNNLGMQFQRMGDKTRATAAYQSAVRVLEQQESVTPSLAAPLNNLASLAREDGRLDDARALYLRARARLITTLGAEHERTSNCVLGLALIAQDEARFDEAKVLMDEVVRVRSKLNPRGTPALEALVARAALHIETGDSAGARATIEATRALLSDGNDDVIAVRAELDLAAALLAIEDGKLEGAASALHDAERGASRAAPDFSIVLAVARAVADGQPLTSVSCDALPRSAALGRVLAKRCPRDP